ncbi:phosphomannomutase CpsG [Chitiniphilus purpureus]|uniref:Phosphomannomutase CpsG n=1 Tax=Chitiniphilus purpureus TaxID=2981137 RepID=A0ABY6DRG0_9NEIS|nr:phosphomannomutase CpsG [Chitiniphilus sp. CD1]UXY16298.1 phosphomannomutase CpsG [Chitiniphilus sp. CD1]
MAKLGCFTAYDIRGRIGDTLSDEIAYRIGRAYCDVLQPRTVVIGGDSRLSTPVLKRALARGLAEGGCDVLDLGLTGTEEIYFATWHLNVDGGIEVTASHNPAEFNGMKLVRAGAVPISGDSGLHDIQRCAEQGDFRIAPRRGTLRATSVLDAYVDCVLGFIDPAALRPLKVVVNAGHGAAGHAVDALAARLARLGAPLALIRLQHEPDGRFPHGVPNPMLPQQRAATADAVRQLGADFGVAWDGDFDRCFLFDEQGAFVEGYYLVGLLAQALLRRHPGERIIHDPRLIWNTQAQVAEAGGIAIQSKTGHAFIKERMREENALYGGEMSGHHYFRDFAYCDSGMIPWLMIAELICQQRQPLSALLAERIAAFPVSGEINLTVADTDAALERIRATFGHEARSIDQTDGLSLDTGLWRCNVRRSNTEPLLRLNVETRGDPALLQQMTERLLALLGGR